MRYAITKAAETHDEELVRSWREADGWWHHFRCLTCRREVQWGPNGPIVVNPAPDALTNTQAEELSDRVVALHKQGRHGEANKLCASVPGHVYKPPNGR